MSSITARLALLDELRRCPDLSEEEAGLIAVADQNVQRM
jgi:hypothetical protein